MLTTASQTSAELANALLTHYSFDLSGYTASELINRWQSQYPVNWLHLAVVEALYQGRYKGISVQQILAFWQRRGQVIYHFNMEFERLICSKFPESLTEQAAPVLPEINQKVPVESASIRQPVTANSLPAMVGNEYRQTQTATLKPMNAEEEEKPRKNILASSTLSTAADATQSRLNSQGNIQRNSPSPKLHQPTKLLPPSANHPPIGQFTPSTSDQSDSFTSKLKAMSDDHR
ncbi:hypothetical protein [Nodularia sphaerocarpa]|uniref:hypothetical protein n=2 Tax=Nodularia sphaerocarpa TaxID=137816 RepID=UPI001EFBBA30|nr:hypothetical protein [Nodularia sphaerocarpa]MDB9374630.1 hypothetical protein [Nodularia sphaerocarpa CS-585]ULP74864.1 hypothetical protein BDGGKGIB_04535 [Nodularia sphaerocarpa UHCC 0038]